MDPKVQPFSPSTGALLTVDPAFTKALKYFPWLKAVMWVQWVAFTLYLFTLPLLSDAMNNGVRLGGIQIIDPMWPKLCKTPADQIHCGSLQNYTEIAVALGRQVDGQYVGCGCGEGVLGDNACMVNIPQNYLAGKPDGFSVSYYIGTGPGTGSMAALSSLPILGMWGYGLGSYDQWLPNAGPCFGWYLGRAVAATLTTFQLAYGGFLMCTFCVYPTMHFAFVGTFIASLALHFVLIAVIICYSRSKTAMDSRLSLAIMVITVLGSSLMVIGTLWPTSPSWMGQHAFWLAECVGLSTGSLIGPLVFTYGSTDESTTADDALLHSES
ncbi:unnamed protein product [Prorocentrum cordatum]|uniref:Uncharacterized protein n=1 Tax=Prorocentrum cordatum TaxID=2364126 RepID=A0ABN9X2E3_9DINO|nr:unnamed protein product [Polarella glacialis]